MTQMNLFTDQKQTHRLRKQIYGYQRGREGSDTFGLWDFRLHTTVYKINKVLLYNTGNYTPYLVITYK